MHWYEVVQIVHELHDLHDGEEKTYGDDHFVRVLVRPVPDSVIREATLGNENVAEHPSETRVGVSYAEGIEGNALLDDRDDPLLN